ncbi:hypothetical protein [Ferroacidibacillus organovorans]|uniref:Uncharacterized protein n=1 Tax=Ferroacidibacillus organovorans TaxID=1765683 RepID=A0A101XPV1_9BACL|nr:hypothetical protein [Ferroacidibacillus organovorans]KUO95365.1 hypothetical protein ATW55_10950 [Ferroacidibacillus organovorans]
MSNQDTLAPSSSGIRPLSERDLRKNRFGMSLYCISQAVPYFLLINIRFVIAGNFVPVGLNLWLGGILPTLALLIGILPLFTARAALQKNDIPRVRSHIMTSLLLGIIGFLSLLIPLWFHNFDALSPFGEIDLISLGVACFYTLIALIVVWGVYLRLGKGLIQKETGWGLEGAIWTYVFNALAWTALFVILDLL